eukprot:8385448-Alexandrium_andersonii.AAC.1
MSASLVGSEMCIRDRSRTLQPARPWPADRHGRKGGRSRWPRGPTFQPCNCLLYTSDAADDM